MAASTVPAAKQAILDLLIAVPALNEAGITWNEPTEQEDLQDALAFFVDPVVRSPNWGPLGGAPIDEEYTLTLCAKRRYYGDDRGAAEVQSWEFVAEIEQALRADLRLGGVLFKPLDFGEQRYGTHPLSDGFFGEITIPLVCTARI